MVFISDRRSGQTAVSNAFIDHYLPAANGEYVKVYLMLLRLLVDRSEAFSVAALAERLDHTEKDVLRALAYWEKMSLLELIYEDGVLSRVAVLEVPEEPPAEKAAAKKEDDTARPERKADLEALQEDEEFRQLLYVAETYLSRTLTPKDLELFAYLYENLHFSPDLIEYLVEYCVDGGHKSTKYIEAVALGWHSEGKTTVEQVKEANRAYTRENKQVMKAFGITNRVLGTEERRMVQRWIHDYEMPLEVVVEACSRTLAAIHQPSFEYADRILRSWRDAKVTTVGEAKAYADSRRRSSSGRTQPAKPKGSNRFHNFDQRATDYDALLQQEARRRNGTDESTG